MIRWFLTPPRELLRAKPINYLYPVFDTCPRWTIVLCPSFFIRHAKYYRECLIPYIVRQSKKPLPAQVRSSPDLESEAAAKGSIHLNGLA